MLRFSFESGTKATCPGLKVACTAQYSEDAAGSRKVLTFGEGDYLTVQEKELDFDGCADYVDTMGNISEDAPYTIPFLKGSRVPFSVVFTRDVGGYRIAFEVALTNEKDTWTTSMKSTKLLKPEKWYTIDVVFLDGEFYFVVDGEVWIRRVFNGRYVLDSFKSLEFGGSDSHGGFSLQRMEMSKDIYLEDDDEIKAILSDAADNNACSFENAFLDVLEAGENPGDYVKTENVERPEGVTARVYENGTFYESPAHECIYLSAEFCQYFKWHTMPSFPLTRGILIPNKVSYVMFDNYTLFHENGTGLFPELLNKTMERYLEKDPAEYQYWYPDPRVQIMANTIYNNAKKGNLRTTVFTNGLAISEVQFKDEEPYAVILPKEFFANGAYAGGILEAPIGDYSVTIDNDGFPFHYCVPLRNGKWVHYFIPWEELLLTDRYLGPASTNGICFKKRPGKENVEFCDFEGGVVVRYPETKDLIVHTGMLLRLGGVSIGEIDDGAFDNHAELVVKLYVYTENGTLANGERFGADSRKDPSYYTFNARDGFNEFILSPMHGYSYLRLFVKIYDYDSASDNDYLGSFDYTFSIENGWWMDQSETYGAYSVGMTSDGKHNRHGVGNGRLDFGVGDVFDMEEMKKHWRMNLAFPFHNFTGSYPFTPDEFGRLFSNVRALTNPTGRWWDIQGFIFEEIIYGYIKKHMIDVGRCYGFALVEAQTFHGQGIFIPPMYKYGLKPEIEKISSREHKANDVLTYDEMVPVIGRTIVDAYMRQAGWDYISWIWRAINSGEYMDPFISIKKIRDTIDNEGCCIVDIIPDNSPMEECHAVLAYKYEGDGIDTKFFILDSNFPYYEPRDRHYVKDCNYIAFEGSGKKVKKAVLHHPFEGAYGSYEHILAAPYSLSMRPARVPNLHDVTVGVLSNMVFGWIEGVGNLIASSAGGASSYDGQTASEDFMFVPIASDWVPDFLAGGEGKGNALFLTKDGAADFQIKAKEAGSAKITLAAGSNKIEVTAHLARNESLYIKTKNVRSLRKIRLALSRDKKGGDVEVVIGKVKDTEYYSHRLTQYVYVPKKGTASQETVLEGQKYGARILTYGTRKDGSAFVESNKLKRYVKKESFLYRARPRRCPGAVLENATLSVRQCASIYNLSQSTVRAYCRDGIFATAFKKSGKWAIPKVEVPTMKIK